MTQDLSNRLMRSKRSPRETCPICMNRLFDQEIGIPDSCQHVFCFDCLANWNRLGKSTCPNDRRVFQFIFKKHSITSQKPFAKVSANNTDLEISLEEEEEEKITILSCSLCDNEDQDYHPLLTCNECGNSYHEFCLNSFNRSKWICPSCECCNEERSELINNLSTVKPTKTPLGNTKPLRRLQHTSSQQNHISTKSSRSIITPKEAARRIAASGVPVLPDSRSAALRSQARYMATLRQKRKLVTRLPPKIPINQLPQIQRRSDAPVRPQSKPRSTASFLDGLLRAQNQLHSLQNIQMQGAHIKLS